jgi:hypothetical protein
MSNKKFHCGKSFKLLSKNGSPLQDVSGKKELYLYKNIIPIPHALVKSFLDLSSFDPNSVAKILYATMKANATADSLIGLRGTDDPDQVRTPFLHDDPSEEDDDTSNDDIIDSSSDRDKPSATPITRNAGKQSTVDYNLHSMTDSATILSSPWLFELQHAIYFCYLCSINKMENVSYTIPPILFRILRISQVGRNC